jgi:proline iminopeptidase
MTPDAYTNQELMLDVGDGHTLYVHDWGNPKAKTPIVFLHGGPGSGCKDKHKSAFDPTVHRVIFHDQRGTGKSLPYGERAHNTTDKLVEDIEAIATKLKLPKFILTGGSWGSTLALMYAIKHPKRVEQLVVRGIFTARQSEIDWLDEGYFKLFYPEVWERYENTVPKTYRNNPTAYHAKNILGKDPAKQITSARAYSELEGSIMSIDDRTAPSDSQADEFDPVPTTLEVSYLHSNCFIPEGYIMRQAAKLTMPVWIVQGRFDMVCPAGTAYELHQRIKGSKIIWTMAGHGNDRSTYDSFHTLFLSIAS